MDVNETAPLCLNCGAVLQGKFCHACGQGHAHIHVSVGHFLHEVLHESLHLDGKIARTLKLLLSNPGALTQEFLSGRRTHYIAPLRLFLTMSVLFFALTAVLPGQKIQIHTRAPDPATLARAEAESDGSIATHAKIALVRWREQMLIKARDNPEKAAAASAKNIPRGVFVLLPIFALLTWTFFRRRHRYYIAHVYYALHFHAFAYLLLTMTALLRLGGRFGNLAGAVVLLSLVPYHFLALRRAFGGSVLATLVKGSVILVAYLYVLRTGDELLLAWTLLTL